ncbi:hypothetical protein GBA52_025064 [Prunus armeniaca]|nr:hypothetical protein GBA52_025064 [Prunus armeniaca]
MRAHLLQLILRKVLQEGLRVSKQKLPSLNYGAEGTEEMTDSQCNTQLADRTVPETDLKPVPSARDVKDFGLDPNS